MNEKLQLIRQKCIDANPTDDRWNVILADEEKVRLADVLLAVERKHPGVKNQQHFAALSDGRIVNIFNSTVLMEKSQWNLPQDDLTQQSEHTINFLYDLLK